MRKLDEGIAKLRRARHMSRRYRDRRELANMTDVAQALEKTVHIDSPSVSDTRKVNELVKSQVVGANEEADMATQLGRRNCATERTKVMTQMLLRFKEPNDQVKINSANESSLSWCNQQRRDDYDRFSTQPVTYAEVQEAVLQNSQTAIVDLTVSPMLLPQAINSSQFVTKTDDVDPSKLSLVERVKLFNRRIATESVAKAGISFERAQRRPLSRFRTQPVTSQEVEVAVRNIPPRITDLKRNPTETVGKCSLFINFYL